MTWLQQLLLTVLIGQQAPDPAQANLCADVVHKPAGGVAYRPDASIGAGPGVSVDPKAIQVPIVVDVLRERGRRLPLVGEAWLGTATSDGETVTLQGPAFNDGAPVRLGADCRPLEPGERKPQAER